MYNTNDYSVVMFDENYVIFEICVEYSGKYIFNEGDFEDYLTIAIRNVEPYRIEDENAAIREMVLPKYKDFYYVNKITATYHCRYTNECFTKEISLEN
jgi:hypothetical protein